MKLKLTNSPLEIIVDDDVSSNIVKANWCLTKQGYAFNKVLGYLHDLVIITKLDFEVDHINRDKLDNRKSNLRPATKAQNQFNRAAPQKGIYLNHSNIHGITYQVKLRAHGVNYYGGTFTSIGAAKRAYNKLAKEKHGKFAFQHDV